MENNGPASSAGAARLFAQYEKRRRPTIRCRIIVENYHRPAVLNRQKNSMRKAGRQTQPDVPERNATGSKPIVKELATLHGPASHRN